MKRRVMNRMAIVVATLAASTSAHAATVFVGSWDVYSPAAPVWFGTPPNGPLAYTGQEAAALLFGGNANDYLISSIDNNVANINNSAWYDVIGFGKTLFAENYSNKYLGQFYGPTSGPWAGVNAPASAYVRDNLQGQGAINYAFRLTANGVPEPATWAMMLGGFGLVGGALRKNNGTRRQKVSVTYA